MSLPPDDELAERLTGLCTFLLQPPAFVAGEEVCLSFQYERRVGGPGWVLVPSKAVRSSDCEGVLEPSERSWGKAVVLVRATLAWTGGVPRDSMNQPTDEYDPDALTLSDVRVVDRSPQWDAK